MFLFITIVTALVQFDISDGTLTQVRSDEDVIEIPASVTKIVGRPFDGLTATELKCATGSKILSAEARFLEGSSFQRVTLTLAEPVEAQFADLPYLRNVVITESWENIPSELFSGCLSLVFFQLHNWQILSNRNLFFYNEIKTVGQNSFKDVMFIFITFSVNAQNPWSFHFAGHPQLQIINVHTKLDYLRTRMFDGCVNLRGIISDGEDLLDDGHLNLIGIKAESKLVAHVFRGVPINTIQLELVTQFDSWFFEDLHAVTTIIYHSALPTANFTIPDSSSWFPQVHTISIGSYDIMIENVIDLSHVPINNLGAYAFRDVEAWQIFLHTNGRQTSIPPYCFASCPYLEYVYIPFSISSIPEGCFYNCTSLRSLNILGYELIEDGTLYIYNSALRTFQAQCFSYVPFWRIVFGTSVILYDRAFSNNEFLFEIELVTLLNTVTLDSPKSSPFRLTNLEIINVPRGSFCYNLPAFSPYFFLDTPLQTSPNWQSVSICSDSCQESLSYVGFTLHPNCSYRLVKVTLQGETITIPDPIRYISGNSFDASSATTVYFGAGVEQIDDYAFRGSKIQSVIFHQNYTRLNYALFTSFQTLVSVEFRGNVRVLPAHCFYSCNQLNSLKINGNDVLYQTSTDIVLDLENLTSVGRDAFFGVEFTDLKIPSAIENHGSIGIGSTIRAVQIYGFLTSFPISMFRGCTNLEFISINNEPILRNRVLNLTAFYNINIGASAFAQVNIEQLIFSRAVTFHSVAFSNCPLRDVYYASPIPPRFAVPAQLRGLSSLVNLYMDSRPVIVNRRAVYDSFFYNFDAFADLPIISANVSAPYNAMFDQCNQLENVSFLYQGIPEIQDDTFRDCAKLKYVSGVLQDDVLDTGFLFRIGDNAFFNVAISKIIIRCNFVMIGDYAFAENTQLKSVEFINVTANGFEIEEGAQIFFGVKTIESITIPQNIYCSDIELPFLDVFSGSNVEDKLWEDYGCTPGVNPSRPISDSDVPNSEDDVSSESSSNSVVIIVVIIVVIVLVIGAIVAFVIYKRRSSGGDMTTNASLLD